MRPFSIAFAACCATLVSLDQVIVFGTASDLLADDNSTKEPARIQIDTDDDLHAGRAALSSDDWDTAFWELTRGIQKHPNDCRYYAARAHALKMAGDYSRAIADVTEAIRLAPENKTEYPLFLRAKIFEEMGKLNCALKDYEQIAQQKPDCLVYRSMTMLLLRMGESRKALGPATLAIEHSTDELRSSALLNRSMILRHLGDWDKALADVNESIVRSNHRDYLAYSDRGDVLSHMGKYKEAIADYSEAISLEPDCYFAYLGRAEAYHRIGDEAKRQKDLREVNRTRLLTTP